MSDKPEMREKDGTLRLTLGGILIGMAGLCAAVVTIPAFIMGMGGFPDPGHQSDFYFELVLSHLCGASCILAIIGLLTVTAIVCVSRDRSNCRHD